MIASRRSLALAGLALFGLYAGHATSQDTPAPPVKPPPRLDVGKSIRIEPRIEALVKNAAPAPAPAIQPGFPNGPVPFGPAVRPRLDIGKSGVIEPQFQQFVQGARIQQMLNAAKAETAKSEFVNPKVEPGKVRWHKSFEEAKAAAAKSKRPIMVFQMMGKLDDQFC